MQATYRKEHWNSHICLHSVCAVRASAHHVWAVGTMLVIQQCKERFLWQLFYESYRTVKAGSWSCFPEPVSLLCTFLSSNFTNETSVSLPSPSKIVLLGYMSICMSLQNFLILKTLYSKNAISIDTTECLLTSVCLGFQLHPFNVCSDVTLFI